MDIPHFAIHFIMMASWSPFLAVRNKGATSIHIQDFVWTLSSYQLYKHLGGPLLHHIVKLRLALYETATLPSKVAKCISTSNEWEILLPHILARKLVLLGFWISAILIGMQCYLTVVLICNWMTNYYKDFLIITSH